MQSIPLVSLLNCVCWRKKVNVKGYTIMYINRKVGKTSPLHIYQSIQPHDDTVSPALQQCYNKSSPVYTASKAQESSLPYSARVQLLLHCLASHPQGSAPLLLPKQHLCVTPEPTPTQESDTCMGVAAVSPPAC